MALLYNHSSSHPGWLLPIHQAGFFPSIRLIFSSSIRPVFSPLRLALFPLRRLALSPFDLAAADDVALFFSVEYGQKVPLFTHTGLEPVVLSVAVAPCRVPPMMMPCCVVYLESAAYASGYRYVRV
jgi:hypothetical protein